MKQSPEKNRSRGFTLLEMAVVLVIAGLMVGMAARTHNTAVEPSGCYQETQKQLATIREAIIAFTDKNNRMPIPAGRSLGVKDPNFGREAASTAHGSIDRLATGAYITNPVVFGALPFQALGLNEYYAADCWGNKFTYVVTEKMTSSASSGGYPDTAVVGGITLKSSAAVTVADPGATPATGIAYAVISHGENGVKSGSGGVTKNYMSATDKKWCNVSLVAPLTPLENENCNIADATLVTAAYNNGANAGTAYFDDVVTFGSKNSTNTVESGDVYCWGKNESGQCGNGTTTTTWTATKVLLPAGMKAIEVSAGHHANGCAIVTTGDAYCWGKKWGMIGNGDSSGGTQSTPQLVTMPFGVKFTKIHVGPTSVCALGTNQRIYCWGGVDLLGGSANNSNGELGSGSSPLTYNVPTLVDTSDISPAMNTFTEIAQGLWGNCAIGTDSKPYCWGSARMGRLGDGQSVTNAFKPQAVPVPAGLTYSHITGNLTHCVVGSDSKTYCWGSNINTWDINDSDPTVQWNAFVGSISGARHDSVTQVVNPVATTLPTTSDAMSSRYTVCAYIAGSAQCNGDYIDLSASPADITNALNIIGNKKWGSWHGMVIAIASDGKLYGWRTQAKDYWGVGNYGMNTTPQFFDSAAINALGITGFYKVSTAQSNALAIAKQ